MGVVTFAGDCKRCSNVFEEVADKQLYEQTLFGAGFVLFPRRRNASGRETRALSVLEPVGSLSSFATSGWP